MLDTVFVAAGEKKSRRLMVVLHGLGDSSAGYQWLPMSLDLPWMNYLLVNAPDSYFGGYSWYDFAGDMGPGIRRSRDLLFDLLDEQRKQGFPTGQTVVFGFSQGCLMTMEVGCRYPHLFSGLVGVSGYVHEPDLLLTGLSPVARQQRFLVTHGYQDPIVPFAITREQIRLLKGAGLNVSWHEFNKPHTIAGEPELDLIRDFIGAGYDKPSGGK